MAPCALVIACAVLCATSRSENDAAVVDTAAGSHGTEERKRHVRTEAEVAAL